MKRIKVQRGYLAQNPYKRAKFYDQGFENVRNPPRTPHLQTYGKKYDLMKLLQVVTALMQLRKNEVNNSPVTYFKEGMKRNMGRIKPAIKAAEQQFLGKTALDSLYNQTMSEIREMLFTRPDSRHDHAKLAEETDEERREAYRTSRNYEKVAELVKDLVKQYKGKKELGSLATRFNDDLSVFKKGVIEFINKQNIGDDDKKKQILAVEKEIMEFFNPENLDARDSRADNSGLRDLYPIMHKKATVTPSNISSANAILDGAEDYFAMLKNMEAEKLYYDPLDKSRMLYMDLTGKTPTEGDLIHTQHYLETHPDFSGKLNAARLRLAQANDGAKQYALGSNTPQRQIKEAENALNKLVDDFNQHMLVQNQTSWPVARIPVHPANTGSNIPLVPEVLTTISVPPLPPSLP